MLYVAWQAGSVDARRGGLAVLGVAAPERMALLREAPIDVATRRMAIADGVALMVGSYDWQAYGNRHRGAMDPVDPRPVGAPLVGARIAYEYVAAAIDVIGTTAYVLEPRTYFGELAALRVLDVGEPLAPRPVTILGFPGPPRNLVATPSRLYVAAGESGLRVVDVASGGRPVDLGRASEAGQCVDDVALTTGALAVLDACAGRVAVYGLSDDGWPVALGDVAVPSGSTRIAWVGGLVAVARGESGGVLLVDAGRPEAPVAHGTWVAEGSIGAVAAVKANGDGNGDAGLIVAVHPTAGLTTLRASTDGQPPRVAGHLDAVGGKHFELMGDLLVAGTDRGLDHPGRLDFIDVSDPGSPRPVGAIEVPWVNGLVAHPTRNIIYVAASTDGLRVIDVSDPTSPVLAAVRPNLTFTKFVRGAGGLVAVDASGLWTLDIADPTAPVVGARENRIAHLSSAVALAASADRAYIISRTVLCGPEWYCADLEAVDVSDPAQPRSLSTHKLGRETQPQSLAVDGGEVLLGGSTGLSALDAAALERAFEPLASYAAPGPVLEIVVMPGADGARQVVTAEGDAGLGVYRLERSLMAPPTSPIADPLPTPRATPAATMTPWRDWGQRLFLPFAARQAVAEPRHPELRLVSADVGPTFGLAIGDGVVYRGQGGAITVIESGPGEPREIGRTAGLPGLVFDLAVADDRLFAAVGEVGLAVYSLADPRRPVLLGTAPTGDAARSVAVSGTVAFVAAGDAGLIAFDVANPAAPHVLSTTPIVRRALRVWLHRDHAYVAAADRLPIEIIDVADPANPRRVAQLDGEGGSEWAMAFHDDLAFLVTCGECMKIFDIADPTHPQQVADRTGDVYASDIAIDGQHLFTASGPRLRVFDLADPLAPKPLAELPLRRGQRIAVRGGLVATAGDDGDFHPEDTGFLIPPGLVEIIDASVLDQPRYLGAVRPPLADAMALLPAMDYVQAMQVEGTTGYAIRGRSTFAVLDCGVTAFSLGATGAATPIAELSALPFTPTRCGLDVLSGQLVDGLLYAPAWVGDEPSGLIVVDVDVP